MLLLDINVYAKKTKKRTPINLWGFFKMFYNELHSTLIVSAPLVFPAVSDAVTDTVVNSPSAVVKVNVACHVVLEVSVTLILVILLPETLILDVSESIVPESVTLVLACAKSAPPLVVMTGAPGAVVSGAVMVKELEVVELPFPAASKHFAFKVRLELTVIALE